MSEKIIATEPTSDNGVADAQIAASEQFLGETLKENVNRKVITDFYVPKNISNEPKKFQFNVFVRLNAKKETTFKNVSFIHCIFDNCYLYKK
ncbi:MAG: hypothetical protein WCH01_17085 [Methylococcaceae bacterium]